MSNILHSALTGDDLHIGKSNVSTGTPVGNQTAGVIGEFYWDSTNNLLYVAEATGTANWVASTSEFDEFIELTDTPSTFTAQGSLILAVNSGATAVEFTDTITLNATSGLTIGASIPFVDSSGTLTLQNIDALDTTTETTIETAIDTLANLTSIQGQTVSFSGSLTVELASTLNQDLTTDASPTFAGLTSTGTITAASGTWSSVGIDLGATDTYAINGLNVLTTTSLGSGILSSSLTTVGALDSGSITSNFGSINTGSSTIQTTGLGTLGSLRVTGTFADSSGDVGTSGQLLSSTVTGTNWIDEPGGGDVSKTGTPVNNQLAIWTDSTTIEGDSDLTFDGSNLTTTGNYLAGDGTLSLPAFTFTSDPDTGIYRDSAGVLAVTSNGADILKTSAIDATKLAHALISLDFDTDNESPFITFGLVSAESEADLFITSGAGSRTVHINVGSTDGAVQLGRATSTGQGTLQVATDGHVTIGTQSNLVGTVADGDVLILGAKTADATLTRMILESPANNDQFKIGVNDVASDSGSAFLDYPDGTEFRLKTSAGTAISISSLDVALGGNVDMVGDLFIGDTTDHATIAVNTGYDLSTINFDFISFSIVSEESNAQGIAFNSDGSKMYVTGQGNDAVFEYDLSTNFDVSTAVYNSITLSVSSEDATPRALEFNTAGTKMFVLGASNDRIFQYVLTTGFDLSTASFDSESFSVTNEETGPTGFTFTADGLKLYVIGSNDTVYQYSLSIAFDITTVSFDSVSFNATAQDTNFREVKLNLVGTKMFLLGAATESLYQYSLSTAFDVSTASYDSVSFSITAEEETPRCFVFNSDGTAIFVLGTTNDSVFQYTISPSLSIIPTAELTAIIGSFSVKTDNADTVSVLNLTTSGTNGGTSSIFVGDQDPDGTITGAGGDIYVKDSAALSNMFFNKEATTGTGWQTVSLLPATVNQLFSTAEYEALGTASIIDTTTTRSLRFHASVTSSTRHTISSNTSELQFIDPTENNQMIYTGTSTFITSTLGGDVTSRNAALIAGISGTQLFDLVGEAILPGIDIVEIIQSSNLAQWDLGTVSRISTGELGPIIRFKDTNIISTTDPLILDACSLIEITSCIFADTAQTGSGGPLFSIKSNSFKEGRAVFLTNGGELFSGESLVRVDAGISNEYRVEVIDSLFILRTGATLFDTSGSTGTFTAVADNSISATAITSVTDSSGVASFVHAGTSPLLNSLVTVSGFTTNTDYNTTGIVTARTATTFEIDYIAFGTTETGSYLVTGVTVTATAHGLTIGTGVTLDTTEATDYDGGFLIYNIQTNSFDVPETFTQTEVGTWSTEGLDQSDPRVRAFNNPETADSHSIAGGFVNGNSTATGTIVNNTFTDMVFGTSTGLTQISTTERWKQIDSVNGTFEFKGLDPFDGLITFDFTVESSGGTVDFRFKWQKSTDGGSSFSDLTDAVEALVAVGSDAQSITKTFPLEMNEGDQIKPQITRNSGSSGITSTYASIYITNPA